MYFRNFGPTLAFLIRSRIVLIWTSSILRIRPFAALYASSASFALSRSYIAIIRSSFSTSARGSSATLSINAKTVEGLSDGGAGSSRSTGRSLWSRRPRRSPRVKCGYKLIQYMACGLRVVASPVGVNAQLVERDRNGLLAVTPDDWYSALTLLRREPAHGWRLGLVGRAKIQEGYTTESAVARLVSLFAEIACG